MLSMSDKELKLVVDAWFEGKDIQAKGELYDWQNVPKRKEGYTPNFAKKDTIWRIKPEGSRFWVGVIMPNGFPDLAFARNEGDAKRISSQASFCEWIVNGQEWSSDGLQTNANRADFHERMSRMGNTD